MIKPAPAGRLSEAQRQLNVEIADVMKRLSVLSNNAREISENHPIRYAANRAQMDLYESPLVRRHPPVAQH